MLPDFARRWEKSLMEAAGAIDRYAVLYREAWDNPEGDIFTPLQLLDRELRARVKHHTVTPAEADPWTTSHLCMWWMSGRPALVVDSDTWGSLAASSPPPGKSPPPFPDMVVYVDGLSLRLDCYTIHQAHDCNCLLEVSPFLWDEAPDYRHRVALKNLFALMADRSVTQAPINGGHTRRLKPGERVKAAHRPYTRISLTAPIRRRAEPSEPTGRQLAAHLRRGHWKRYWVRDPQGRPVLATKPGKHGDLHEVRQWVRPCKVGQGEPQQRQYKVDP